MNRIFSISVVIISVFVVTFGDRLQCKDPNGQPVDWFAAIKLPNLRSTVSDGTVYVYLDAKNPEWTVLTGITTKKSSIGETVSQIYAPTDKYNNSIAWIVYNDAPTNMNWTDLLGHSKGMMAANEKSGFWLVHSVPHFPYLPYQSNNSYAYPKTGIKFGQSFLCMSMVPDELDKVEDETVTISKTIYRGQNNIVINSRMENGCRVLLNREDLFALQNLESVIFESVAIKSMTTRPGLLFQFNQLVNLLTEGVGVGEIITAEEMKDYISHIPDEKIPIVTPSSQPSFINQFRLFSLEHLAEETLLKLELKLPNFDYSPPSLLCIDQPMLNIDYEPLSCHYSILSPSYSTHDDELSRMLPLSPPTLDVNDGSSFYDLLHISSPPVSPINISAPKRLKKAKHVYPAQSRRVKRELFQDMLCDNE